MNLQSYKEELLTDYQCTNFKTQECIPMPTLATALCSSDSFLLETSVFSFPEMIIYLNIMLFCSVDCHYNPLYLLTSFQERLKLGITRPNGSNQYLNC